MSIPLNTKGPYSVPSRSFSILIFILFFFIIIAAKRRHLMSKLPKEHFAQTVTKELGSPIWNNETWKSRWLIHFTLGQSRQLTDQFLDSKCLESRFGLIPRTACPLFLPLPPPKKIFPNKWFFFFTHICGSERDCNLHWSPYINFPGLQRLKFANPYHLFLEELRALPQSRFKGRHWTKGGRKWFHELRIDEESKWQRVMYL